MSYYSKNTKEALAILVSPIARVHESSNVACLIEGAPVHRHHGGVNQTGWRRLKRMGWVEEVSGEWGPGEGWNVWRISDQGRQEAARMQREDDAQGRGS